MDASDCTLYSCNKNTTPPISAICFQAGVDALHRAGLGALARLLHLFDLELVPLILHDEHLPALVLHTEHVCTQAGLGALARLLHLFDLELVPLVLHTEHVCTQARLGALARLLHLIDLELVALILHDEHLPAHLVRAELELERALHVFEALEAVCASLWTAADRVADVDPNLRFLLAHALGAALRHPCVAVLPPRDFGAVCFLHNAHHVTILREFCAGVLKYVVHTPTDDI